MGKYEDWDIGLLAENHEEVQGRPKVRELLKKFVWRDIRSNHLYVYDAAYYGYVGLRPIDLSEIERFFPDRPWLSLAFRISSTAPLEHILDYFKDMADVKNMATDLDQAQNISARPIAHGGLADIYNATLKDGSQVAVKCLRQQPQGDNKELKRTARELDTWSKLDHPHILKLFGLAQLRGSLSMISPWMEYGNVVSVVRQWPHVDRYDLCTQLVDAVDYLHNSGVNVVHGDIKGDNVLVDQHAQVKLTDFGLAIMHEQAMRFSETDPGGGTARWMAPELFMENGVRSRETDVYAMGMTMMEIMTGRLPFSEIRFGPAVIKAVSDGRLPEVPELRADPQTASTSLMLGAILRCWAYQPHMRLTVAQVKMLMSFLGPP